MQKGGLGSPWACWVPGSPQPAPPARKRSRPCPGLQEAALVEEAPHGTLRGTHSLESDSGELPQLQEPLKKSSASGSLADPIRRLEGD